MSAPALLVCDSLAWRLDRFEEALARLLGAFPPGVLARVTLGYRPATDMLVLVLRPGASASPRLGALAVAEARFSGLKVLDAAAGGVAAEAAAARALERCPVTFDVTTAKEALATVKAELGLSGDRRGGMRLAAALQVRWPTVEGFLEAYTSDLSSGGVYVSTAGEKPAIGSSVPVELYAPNDADPIRAVGAVVHHGQQGRPSGFGLRLALSDAARGRLEAIVRRLRTQPAPDARRREARVPARLEVHLKTPDDVVREYTTNLSRGGAFVATERPPPVGTRVGLDLVLPDGSRLSIDAEVVRILDEAQARASGSPAGCGLAFQSLAEDARTVLEAYVSSRQDRPVARVLVSDDTVLFRRMLADALRGKGCHVVEAGTAKETFERLVEELLGLDLLVLDLTLPDGNGAELLGRIRGVGGETELTVAVVSGSVDEPALQAELVLAGADEVLPKSLGPEELARRLVAVASARRDG